jgi:hypothetical protein
MTSFHHVQAQLARRMSSVIQQNINGQRRYVETLMEQSVKDGACVGIVELEGSGEALIEIDFPLRFLEKPIFSPGMELRDNQWLSWGAFPTWSATIGSWKTEVVAENTLYVGAIIGIVTFNANRAGFHYSFKARSLTNPTGPDESVGGTM